MTLALLAFALLATPPSAEPITAGQAYDGCVQMLARGAPVPSGSENAAEAYCDAITALDLAAADAMRQAYESRPGADSDSYCLPGAIIDAGDPAPLARAFIAYVDAHPAARSEFAGNIFERALTEKWPCQR